MLLSAVCSNKTTSSASCAASAALRSRKQAVRFPRDQMCRQLSERLSAVIIGQKRSLHAMLPLSPSKRRYTAEEGNEVDLDPL